MATKGKFEKNVKERTERDRAYDASPARRAARAERMKKRRAAEKAGKVKKGDDKVVNHKTPIKKGLKKAATGGTNITSRKTSDKSGSKIRSKKT
jgi:hypothetical protein